MSGRTLAILAVMAIVAAVMLIAFLWPLVLASMGTQ